MKRASENPEPCVFCDIVAGRSPADWVLAPDYWPDAVAFLSNRPLAKDHTLIVPKVHVRDFAFDPDVSAGVMRRAAELVQFSPRPMVLLSLRGQEAGQEIMHFHLHLVPREKGDGLRIVSRSRGGKKSGAGKLAGRDIEQTATVEGSPGPGADPA